MKCLLKNWFYRKPIKSAVRGEDKLVKIYQTIQEKILRKGKEFVLVPVRAIERGQSGITQVGTIRVMIQPVIGIDGADTAAGT